MIINLDQQIDKYELTIRKVLHIGAHHGQEDGLYERLGIEPIYVEANPEVFRTLRERLPHRESHNLAIADRIGTVELRVTSFSQSSSILALKHHKKIYPSIVEVGRIQVPCTTIDEILGCRREQIDFINIDIQGAELLAFRGAAKTLPHVQCILTEVNRAELYEGCALLGEIDSHLQQFGFVRVKSDFRYHRTWGDAFYVKRELVGESVLGRALRAFGLGWLHRSAL